MMVKRGRSSINFQILLFLTRAPLKLTAMETYTLPDMARTRLRTSLLLSDEASIKENLGKPFLKDSLILIFQRKHPSMSPRTEAFMPWPPDGVIFRIKFELGSSSQVTTPAEHGQSLSMKPQGPRERA